MIWPVKPRTPKAAITTELRNLRLGESDITYTLKRSARRRTIAFQIDHEGLSVLVPSRASDGQISRAIQSRLTWIEARLAEWATKPKPDEIRFETGDQLPWRGELLDLIVRDLDKGVRTRIEATDTTLTVWVDPATVGAIRTAAVRGAVRRWYRKQAETHLTPRVLVHAEALGQTVSKVMIRDQKRRWGSCDSHGAIRLNWRLIMMPDALSDYVCAHEAAHLTEANHSPAFWAVVERRIPDWKAKRKAINELSVQLPLL